jgi:hypothetical protein
MGAGAIARLRMLLRVAQHVRGHVRHALLRLHPVHRAHDRRQRARLAVAERALRP